MESAIAASCSVPGVFAPVSIGGELHVDGAVHSPTNADVLADHELDLIIVSSPMSAAKGRALSPDATVRWFNHRRLQREVAALERTGTAVVTIEPTMEVIAEMGLNALAADRSDRVMRAAFFAAGARASTGRAARLFDELRTSRSSQPGRDTTGSPMPERAA